MSVERPPLLMGHTRKQSWTGPRECLRLTRDGNAANGTRPTAAAKASTPNYRHQLPQV